MDAPLPGAFVNFAEMESPAKLVAVTFSGVKFLNAALPKKNAMP